MISCLLFRTWRLKMRKKSHISLATFLMNNMKVNDLNAHKKSFYIGSILPDCIPSFVTRRHTIDETFDLLIKEIHKITINYDVEKGIDRYYVRHLGVITHYLADYFTFPHNAIYPGSIKDHVYYEKELKFSLKEYVKREETQRNREIDSKCNNIDMIIQLIKNTHEEYLKAFKNVKVDIQYIVDLCYNVVDSLLRFFEIAYKERVLNEKHQLCME